jgi:signal peptidase I
MPELPLMEVRDGELRKNTRPTFGDRIAVFGWPYELGWASYEPQRWDVIVFRNPENPMQNFIKRLIGKPGEAIELINGDVFIDGVIQTKPQATQNTLWIDVYNHDYPPRGLGGTADLPMRPMWVQVSGNQAEPVPRRIELDSQSGAAAELRFINGATRTGTAYPIIDDLGYNVPQSASSGSDGARYPDAIPKIVTDTRLSCQITPRSQSGRVELRSSKFEHFFMAVADLESDEVRLEHLNPQTGEREVWQTQANAGLDQPFKLALANADYRVKVELNGQPMLSSTDEQYATTPEQARRYANQRLMNPELMVVAEGVQVTLEHLLIERDIYYRSFRERNLMFPLRGVMDHPFQLGEDEYFALGDNSPASQDSRFWQNSGPHVGDRDYRPGTVPADQLMGRAFFVYWPGFLPLFGKGTPIVPNFGDVRFIY